MTRNYRVLPAAEFDLRYNYRYIAYDNPVAADRWLNKVRKLFEMISRQPFIGESAVNCSQICGAFPVATM
ncbi:MAG TPA: type II toxin-antitoxin system RelE/ParE family toxin [Planctomycetaceae bacterium]|nr:type II toxin-antitoxin system RelE/ParE family toxin [Planctomycetaceae bacterium]